MHRTNSVDYGILLEGELDMEVDGGETVHLRSGDVVVQRGTNHAWINNSDRPAKMAWILIDADPVRIGGRILEPTM
jgi:quercetin dioxygenase-like cupin family protein